MTVLFQNCQLIRCFTSAPADKPECFGTESVDLISGSHCITIYPSFSSALLKSSGISLAITSASFMASAGRIVLESFRKISAYIMAPTVQPMAMV